MRSSFKFITIIIFVYFVFLSCDQDSRLPTDMETSRIYKFGDFDFYIYPADGAINIPVDTDVLLDLHSFGDKEVAPFSYFTKKVEIYFGTTNPPPLAITSTEWTFLFDPSYDPGIMDFNTTYYFQMFIKFLYGDSVVHERGDIDSLLTEIYSFTTEPELPYLPNFPIPPDSAVNITNNPVLFWTGGCPYGHNVTYDIYFGTENPPLLVQSDNTSTSYNPDTLNYETTYYWQIVSTFTDQPVSRTGPVWFFTTRVDPAPYTPGDPLPGDGTTGIPVSSGLSWTGGNPSGSNLTYDIYFGTENPPPLFQADSDTTLCDPGTLSYETTYYWKIVSKDSYRGLTTSGPVWAFTTKDLPYPYLPGNPVPSDGASFISINTDLNCTGGGPGGFTVTYDIYFGTEDPPTFVQSDSDSASYNPGTLSYLTTYYWKIVSKNDDFSLTTSGPVWAFTTEGDPTPYEPSNPYIPDGATDVLIYSGLQWSGGCESSDQITYDIYFGTTNPPSLIQTDYSQISYDAGTLNYSTTYYWQIVAKNNTHGLSTAGHVWSFTTMDQQGPYEPSNPSPADGGTNISISSDLSWTGGGPSGTIVEYDVYFGTINPPPLVSSGNSLPAYLPGNMSYETTYYWQIVAKDIALSVSTQGAVWSFTTEEDPTPYEPSNPSPADGASNISISSDLSWTGDGLSGTTVTYDIYFGTANPPPLVQSDNAAASYDPGSLSYSTAYFWKIVAKNDAAGLSTAGSVWSFTTQEEPAPYEPSNPNPADASTGISISSDLSWTGGGPSGTTVTYDIYFGTTNPPSLVQSDNSSVSYDPGNLSYSTTYYWKIVAKNDAAGLSTPGSVWSFITGAEPVPYEPSDPTPADASTGKSVFSDLSWTGGGQSGTTVTYDIYFGTANPPPLIQLDNSTASYDPGNLAYGTTYYWKIVSKNDAAGLSTSGAVWSFTTGLDVTPYEPSSPSPAKNATGIAINTSLNWTGGGPSGTTITYDIYFGTASSPPLVQSNSSTTSYNPGGLSYGTRYYWKIVAKNTAQGLSRSGDIWSFTTVYNQAPNQPVNPSPSNGASGVSLSTSLSWTGGDPDGHTVTYDIYFGTSSSPPLVKSNNSTTSYNPGTLSSETKYYWKIVAKDAYGASTASSVWSFTALTNQAPNQPSDPSPSNGATGEPEYNFLDWTGGDPDGDTVTYDIYFGTANPPPLLKPGNSTNTYTLDPLNLGTTYYWKIVSKDVHGTSTAGPVWSFTTILFFP
ncbi:hypothetical protein ACFL4T_07120 [candidate division KSB1 bacterium]